MKYHGVTREKVKAVYDGAAMGQSVRSMAKELTTNKTNIGHWLNHPEKYDPYLDEIAIERALDGEGAVYRNLTVWETIEVYRRLRCNLNRMIDREKDFVLIHYAEAWGLSYEAIQKRLYVKSSD